MNIKTMTNATKGCILGLVNAIMVLLASFNVDLSDKQQAAIGLVVNAALVLWIALTRKQSKKRVPDV